MTAPGVPARDTHASRPKQSAASLFAEFVRCRTGLFAEEPREMRRIGERELLGNVVDWLRGEHKLALGFAQHALADQMSSSDAGRALDVIVEAVDGHRVPVGIERKLPLLLEILFP